jgi:hypothetical protein
MLMTIEEIRKYAEEKGLPHRGIVDMCKRLEADYKDGNVDDMEAALLCVYIDGQSEHWKGVRQFLDKNREERAKRKKEMAEKANSTKAEE